MPDPTEPVMLPKNKLFCVKWKKETEQQDSAGDSPTTDSPSEDGLCKICGDHRSGVHFGADSCDSCKAFFRRSVYKLRKQSLFCKRSSKCDINLKTRRSCAACRFLKCKQMGMNEKWVLSDEERARKWQLVLENRRRRQEMRAEENRILRDVLPRASPDSAADSETSVDSVDIISKPERAFLEVLHAIQAQSTLQYAPNSDWWWAPLQRFLFLAVQLTDFAALPAACRVQLLRGALVEVILLQMSLDDRLQTAQYLVHSMDDPMLMDSVAFFRRLHGNGLDKTAILLLSLVSLFAPDRCHEAQARVLQTQYSFISILRRHTEGALFDKCLSTIWELRELAFKHRLRLRPEVYAEMERQLSTF